MYPISTSGSRGRRRPTRRAAERRGRLMVFGALGALLVGGFAVIGLSTDTGGTHAGDCVVGIDLSHSVTVNPGLLDQYLGWVQDVLTDCAEHDAVNFAVFPLTNITRTDTVAPVARSFEVDPDRNAENRRREVLEWIDSQASDKVAALVEDVGPGRGGTDLLASTAVAESYFHDDADFQRLILLTDGLNTQSPADIRTAVLDEAAIEDIIGDLREDGRLPAIDGVSVEMYGIALGEVAQTVPQDRLGQIEDFWRRFVQASGGTLSAYERTYS